MTTRRESLKLRYTIKADADMVEIWSFIAENSSESLADEFNSRIHLKAQQASLFPFSGAPRPHLAKGLRVLFHEKYAIYYLPRPKEIAIIRVLHGSRDLASIAAEGGFVI